MRGIFETQQRIESRRDGILIEKCVNKKKSNPEGMTYSMNIALLRSLNEIISQTDERFIELCV